jgi:hypothetical protein
MHCPPAGALGQVSRFSPQHILQHHLVEAQIRHKFLQLGIPILELLQPSHLVGQQSLVLLPPVKIGRLRSPHLAADPGHRVTVRSLRQNERSLGVGQL